MGKWPNAQRNQIDYHEDLDKEKAYIYIYKISECHWIVNKTQMSYSQQPS